MFSRLVIFSVALFVLAQAEEGDYIVEVQGNCDGRCQRTMTSSSGCVSQSLGGGNNKAWVLLKCKGRSTSLSSGTASFSKAASDRGVSVRRVEEDSKFRKNELWGVDEADGSSSDGERCVSSRLGWRVLVVIIDTGCTPIVRWRDDFKDVKCRNYVDDDGTPTESDYCKDGDGHGTHVGGTASGSIYGVAPRSDMACMRVLDDDGSGWNSWIIQAVNDIATYSRETNRGRKIIVNMSLGGGFSRALHNAVIAATRGTRIVFSLAAGNENQDARRTSPASAGNGARRMVVGAHDKNGRRASFSNYGPRVSISAPGVGIESTTPSGIRSLSGTSMAAPHVAGAMAAVWSSGKWPARRTERLATTSETVVYPDGRKPKLRYLCA